jgi:hypothetical protein
MHNTHELYAENLFNHHHILANNLWRNLHSSILHGNRVTAVVSRIVDRVGQVRSVGRWGEGM